MPTSAADYRLARQLARRALVRVLLPVLLVLCLVAAAAPVLWVMSSRLNQVEANDAVRGVKRVEAGLREQLARLSDGTARIARDPRIFAAVVNAGGGDGQTTNTFDDAHFALQNWDLLYLVHSDGTVLAHASTITTPAPQRFAKLLPASTWPQDHPLLGPALSGESRHGLLTGPNTVALVASHAVQAGAQPAGNGPRTAVVAVAHLAGSVEQVLRARADSAVELVSTKSARYRTRYAALDETQALAGIVPVPGASRGWLRAAAAARLVPDLAGRPALLIAARSGGEVARAGNAAATHIAAVLLLVLLLAAMSSAYLFTRSGHRFRERDALTTSQSHEREVHLVRRELRLLYRSTLAGAFATPVPLLALAVVMRERVAATELMMWLGLALAVAIARAAYAQNRLRAGDFAHSPGLEARVAVLLAGLSGLSVGLGYLWFQAALNEAQEMLFLVVMGGLGVAAVVTLPTLLSALCAYLAGMLVPLSAVVFTRALVNDDLQSALLGFLFVVFCGLLVAANRTLHGFVRESGRLRYANDELVAELRGAQAKLEHERETQLRESATDPLTGLGNRKRFERGLDSEWRRAARTKESVALLLVDVDSFAAYNLTRGQDAGDDCLKRVVACVAGGPSRPGDLIARFRGDVLAVILAGTSLEGAGEVANQMRERILGAEISHGASDVAPHVTVSIGVAALVPDSKQNATLLIKSADLALDEAKSLGRDRVVLARPETVSAASEPTAELPVFGDEI